MKEALVIAVRSMGAARLRTVLTALSVVIGVAAVVVLLGLGNGMRDGFSSAFGNLSRVILINKATAATPDVEQTRSLRERDVTALRNSAEAPDLSLVVPLRTGTAVMRHGTNQYVTTVNGTTPGFLQVRNDTIVAGRMFTEQENADKSRVVVISPKIVNFLFDGNAQSAIGAQVFVGRLTFKVVGVLAPAGDDQDYYAPMPINASRDIFGGLDTLNGIGIVASSADRVPQAEDEIYRILDRQHDVRGGMNFRDYSLTATLDQVNKLRTYVTLLNLLTLVVGGIALFVGTLGVANIMMVTVNNRTIEIGIRKAIGARRAAIVKQFMVESVMLSGLGGIVGTLLGLGLVIGGGERLVALIPAMGPPWVSAWSVATVFGVSLLIGLLAGTFPARRASRLNPIDALRF